MFKLRFFDFKILTILLLLVVIIHVASLGLKFQGVDLNHPLNYLMENYRAKDTNGTTTTNSTEEVDYTALFEAAGNSTLGFQSIQYINLEQNFDREDAIRMQSIVAGLKTTHFKAIGTDLIQDNGKGLPPTSGKELKPAEKACLRSHAELWYKMIDEDIQSMLILEADAAWDVNIRNIHKRLAKGFYDLHNIHNPNSTIQPSKEDPWNLDSWDVISFGSCHDGKRFREQSLFVDDPDAPLDQKYFDEPLNDQRVVRKAGYVVCTTAYAVTLQGAKKLLLRAMLNLNTPVDLMIGDMIGHEGLNVLSVFPPTIAQWAYTPGIGAESLGSTIQNFTGTRSKDYRKIWDNIHKTRNIWDYKKSFKMARFRNSAFSKLNEYVYGPSEDD